MSIKRPSAQTVAAPPVVNSAAQNEVAEVAVSDELIATFRSLPALEQAAFLRQAAMLHEKAVKQALKEAVNEGKKAKKEKKEKDPNAPKREQSESVIAWRTYVQAVHAEMKETDPTAKLGDAMAEASRRREAGDAAAPPKSAPKPKKVASDEEKEAKAAAKAAAKAEAAAAREEAKAAAKAAKESAAAEVKAAKEAEKAAIAEAKEKAKAAAAAAKELAKAASKKPSAAKPAAPAPAPAPAATVSNSAAQNVSQEEDEESLSPWTFKGVNYWRSSQNECWLQTADGQMGKWAGKFDTVKNKIVPAAEPKLA